MKRYMPTLTPTGEKIVTLFKPEAEELVKQALSAPANMSTKDGYAVVMGMVSHLLNEPQEIAEFKRRMIAKCFLIACERAGYPEDTADQIRQILGWI